MAYEPAAIVAVASRAALAAYVSTAIEPNFYNVSVQEAAFSGTYQYNPSSSASADGTNVIRPSDLPATGRWLLGPAQVAGQLPGTTTNDNAAAGKVGEYVSASLAPSTSTGLVSGVVINICSISLTAGDWDVEGWTGVNPAITTIVNQNLGWVSSVSATIPTNPTEGFFQQDCASSGGAFAITTPTGPKRFSLASTTTIYLGQAVTFGTSTCGNFGFLRARRVR